MQRRKINWFVEISKEIYILLVSFTSHILAPFCQPKKIVYLMSFPRNNNDFIQRMVSEINEIDVTIVYTKNCYFEAKKLKKTCHVAIVPLNEFNPQFFKAIKEIVCGKVIICDNYFAILGGIHLSKEATVIQLWHANGAIKHFGWENPQTLQRSFLSKKRFQKVYDRIDKYVVGSSRMAGVFERSYKAKPEQMLPLGYPRSDIYSHTEKVNKSKQQMIEKFPQLKGKQVILCMPTYRENKSEVYPLDIEELYREFGKTHVLIMQLHPHMRSPVLTHSYPEFLIERINDVSTADLLSVADILITDYSSVFFDYTLLKQKGKSIFYCYDLLDYANEIGIQKEFFNVIPGLNCNTSKEVAWLIAHGEYRDFTEFNSLWNTYNDGHGTDRLIQYVSEIIRA